MLANKDVELPEYGVLGEFCRQQNGIELVEVFRHFLGSDEVLEVVGEAGVDKVEDFEDDVFGLLDGENTFGLGF